MNNGVERTKTELLPCPFCGGVPTAIETHPGRGELYCGNCDVVLGGNNAMTPDELTAAWNTRSDARSRYAELFGTPERAARTLEEFELDQINWCHVLGDGCEKCPYEFDRYGCYLPDGFSLLEWLRGDA